MDIGKNNLLKYLKVIKYEENNGKKYIEFIVLSLVFCLPFKGYHLFMDSWFNSISLAKKLLDQGITLTCPVKKNSIDIPKTPTLKNLKDGDSIERVNNFLSFTRWKDKKEMLLISSIYTNEKKNKKIGKMIPEVSAKYSSNMRSVDIMDQNLENLDIKQKSYKWWKPIFYYILEITINNSFIIYNKSGFKTTD